MMSKPLERSTNKKPSPTIRLSLAAIVLLALLAGGLAAAEPAGRVSPVNPDFLSYTAAHAYSSASPDLTSDGRPLGFVPPPFSWPARPAGVLAPKAPGAFPPAYDLRTVSNKLPPIRNQGTCGSCWAFGTYASLEFALRPAQTTLDFSENHLNNKHGFDKLPCAGGNMMMSMAYFARWDGPVDEADDPYPSYTQPNPTPVPSPDGLLPNRHVQEGILLTGDLDGGVTNRDEIKTAVMLSGAVWVAMYWPPTGSDTYYNASTKAWYYNGTKQETTHVVAIVGWNDAFPKTSFNTAPAGDGAYIVRNSWGTAWGDAGYFYLSYYDTNAPLYGTVFPSAEATTNYAHLYQYDPLGYVGGYGWSPSTSAWFANVFTAAGDETVAAAGFYALAYGATYSVYVSTGFDQAEDFFSGGATKYGPVTGSFTSPGYYTVKTGSLGAAVAAGTKFAVVVKIDTPGNPYPVPVEYPLADLSSAATANANESFVRHEDSSAWIDLAETSPNYNAALKAFTDPAPPADGDAEADAADTVEPDSSEVVEAEAAESDLAENDAADPDQTDPDPLDSPDAAEADSAEGETADKPDLADEETAEASDNPGETKDEPAEQPEQADQTVPPDGDQGTQGDAESAAEAPSGTDKGKDAGTADSGSGGGCGSLDAPALWLMLIGLILPLGFRRFRRARGLPLLVNGGASGGAKW